MADKTKDSQGTYQPVGVPAAMAKHPGLTQGIIGIICAIVSLLFFPPFFGAAGIILGVLSLKKGEKALGITTIILSAVFMLAGMAFGIFVHLHPDLFEAGIPASGAAIESLQ